MPFVGVFVEPTPPDLPCVVGVVAGAVPVLPPDVAIVEVSVEAAPVAPGREPVPAEAGVRVDERWPGVDVAAVDTTLRPPCGAVRPVAAVLVCVVRVAAFVCPTAGLWPVVVGWVVEPVVPPLTTRAGSVTDGTSATVER